MKQKITLLTLILLVSVFSFGQNGIKKQLKERPKKEYRNRQIEERESYEYDFKTNRRPSLKSKNIEKQRLDSSIRMVWDRLTSLWVKNVKSEYTFDANGNVTAFVVGIWNIRTSQWENYKKTEYTYDANGNLIVFIDSYWIIETKQWLNDKKYENIYDSNGNLIVSSHFGWNSETRQWANNWKTEYTYDANANFSILVESFWYSETSQWGNHSKAEYNYDSNGNLIVYTFSYWNRDSSQWVNNWKTENTYNTNKNMTISSLSDWNIETSQWEIFDKTDYTYNANGNCIVELYSRWNSQTSEWKNVEKAEYAYDVNGNPTVEIYSNWYKVPGHWENNTKYEYAYDFSYSFSNLILPNSDFFELDYSNLIVNKPVDVLFSIYADTNWIIEWKGIYYYTTEVVSSISRVNSPVYNIYPNPSSDMLNFSFTNNINKATFELYDSQGRMLFSKKIKSNEQISLEWLNDGIYFYYLNLDGVKQSGKLIKK